MPVQVYAKHSFQTLESTHNLASKFLREAKWVYEVITNMRGNNHEGNREEMYKLFAPIYHLTHIIYQEKREEGKNWRVEKW